MISSEMVLVLPSVGKVMNYNKKLSKEVKTARIRFTFALASSNERYRKFFARKIHRSKNHMLGEYKHLYTQIHIFVFYFFVRC